MKKENDTKYYEELKKEYKKLKQDNIEKIIKEICYNLDNHNATMNALIKKYGKSNEYKVKKIIPFTSEKKWSGLTFENNETYIIGAPDIILKEKNKEIEKYEEENRIILLAKSTEELKENLPKKIEPLGFFLIQDEIRNEATKTINFFKENDVEVKIISGDKAKTVSRIATKLGLSFADKYIDTTDLDEEQLKQAATKYSIFGRVTQHSMTIGKRYSKLWAKKNNKKQNTVQ